MSASVFPRFSTLGRRFGALFVLLVGLIAGVCAFVYVYVDRMRSDSERVLEETREQTLAARLSAELEDLQPLVLRPPGGASPAELAHARELLSDVVTLVIEIGEPPSDDPSRVEHQETEEGFAATMLEDLALLDDLLGRLDEPAARAQAAASLERTSDHANVLRDYTREEAAEADQDLEQRAVTTRRIMVGTVLLSALTLAFAFTLVLRTVVRPVKTLERGAVRFGSGDLSHHIQVRNQDEIGALARSLNDMADRLAGTQTDLEERVRARTSEFLRAARLADLGLLASGVAHEINTPLASITSCAEGLERRLANGGIDPEIALDYASTITREASRAREITTRMLALARQEPSQVATVDLELVLQNVESAVQFLLSERGVRLERSPTEGDGSLTANAGELVQVVVNLVANAVDASAAGGVVRLSARLDPRELQIVVRDEGQGIAPGDRERIFEPFYTTKRPGRGTGLGLALVANLVDSHDGHITVESEPGEGSTFRLRLPRHWESSS